MISEALEKHHRFGVLVLHRTVVLLKETAANGLEELVGHLTFEQFVHGFLHGVLGLFHGVILTRRGVEERDCHDLDSSHLTCRTERSLHSEELVVGLQFVQETDTHLVGEQFASNLKGQLVFVTGLDTFVFLDEHRVIAQTRFETLVFSELGIRPCVTSRQRLGLHASEDLLNERLHLLGMEVTDEDKCHVIRHIPRIEELDELTHLGVLEILRITDDVPLVRGTFACFGSNELIHMLAVIVGVHVILLEDVLQLGLERTEDRIRQTIGIERKPTLHLVSRETVVIERVVIRGSGIEAFTTDGLNQVRELIGSSILSSEDTLFVDFELNSIAFLGIIRHREGVVEGDDMLVIGFLFLPIERAHTVGAFEEHVLQIVSQTGRCLRFVNRTGTSDGSSKHIGQVLVFPEHDGEPIVQRVLLQAFRQLCSHRCDAADKQQNAKENLFHIYHSNKTFPHCPLTMTSNPFWKSLNW